MKSFIKNAQNKMTIHLGQFCAAFLLLFLMSGCANTPQNQHQIITKAMVIVPPKPVAPVPETATQRDVAIYITQLRGWGNAMAIQLETIKNLISKDEDKND